MKNHVLYRKVGFVGLGIILLLAVALVVRATPTVAVEWQVTLGGEDVDFANDVISTSDGGYLVAGMSADGYFPQLFVAKTDSLGQLEWEQTLSLSNYSEVAYRVQELFVGQQSDGYLVVGSVNLPGMADYRPWLVRLNPAGTILWSTENGLTQLVSVDSAIVHGLARPDGTFVVVGGSNTFTNPQQPWVLLADGQGNLLQFTQYPPLSSGYGEGTYINDMVATPDGGFALVGVSSPPGLGEAFLWKFSADAQPEWVRLFYDDGFRVAQGVKVTADGGFVLVGCDLPNCGQTVVVKTDPAGNISWQTSYPSNAYSQGQDILLRPDNSYLVSQITFSAFGSTQFTTELLELDQQGNLLFTHELDLGFTSTNLRRLRLTQDNSGFIAAGYGTTDDDPAGDMLLVRGSFVVANVAPVAQPDSFLAPAGQSLSVNSPGLLANDHDPNGDPLTLLLDNAPSKGNLNLNSDGSFLYTPSAGFIGQDSFTYHLSDGNLLSSPTTVTIMLIAHTIYLPLNLR